MTEAGESWAALNVRKVLADHPTEPDAEELEMATAALKRLDARKDEDPAEWAASLAAALAAAIRQGEKPG